MTMKRTNYYLPQEMLDRLRKLNKKTGVPASEYVRRWIECGLKKEKA